MNFDNTLANEYASKPGEWRVEHVTAPRNSCAGMLKFRRALTSILPGYAETIAGLYVKRLDEWDQYRFVIRGNEVTLADAVGILEGRIPVPAYPARNRRKSHKATVEQATLQLVSPPTKPKQAPKPRPEKEVKVLPWEDLPLFAKVSA